MHGLFQRTGKGGVCCLIGEHLFYPGDLDHKGERGFIAGPDGAGQFLQVFRSPFRGGVGEIPRPVHLQRAALYLAQGFHSVFLHVEIHPRVAVGVFTADIIVILREQPFLHRDIGGLAVYVDSTVDADTTATADSDSTANADSTSDADATGDADATADVDSTVDSDATATADAGNNTFTNGNNTVINVNDSAAGLIAISLSNLLMMEGLLGNQNSERIEPLFSQLTNMMNELLEEENSTRKALIDAIKALKSE